MKPVVTDVIGGYNFNWSDVSITASISRVVVHNSDGRVTAEILIQSKDDDGKAIVIYPQTQINFGASTARQSLVKNLLEKYDSFNWSEMVDQLAYGVQDRARRGEPLQEKWTHEEPNRPEWLIEPILLKGLPTVVYGEKGVAKSTMALVCYFCLLLPWANNTLELQAPSRSIKSVILDWETDFDVIHYAAKRIQIGHDLSPIPIMYRRCSMPLADDIEAIQRVINDSKAEIVIIDSLGAASGGELNKPEGALRFFTALRQLKVGSLIIAQTSKDTETKQKSIYGSTFFTYYARNILELCRSDSSTDENLSLTLFHRWSNLSKRYPPMSFHLHHNEAGLNVKRVPYNGREFLAKMKAPAQVYEVLKRGALSLEGIYAELPEVKQGTIRQAVNRLKEDRKLFQLPDLKWGLISKE